MATSASEVAALTSVVKSMVPLMAFQMATPQPTSTGTQIMACGWVGGAGSGREEPRSGELCGGGGPAGGSGAAVARDRHGAQVARRTALPAGRAAVRHIVLSSWVMVGKA